MPYRPLIGRWIVLRGWRKGEALRRSELTEETCIPKSTFFRIFSTLEDRKTYRLGMKLWELGNSFLEQSDLYEAAADYMKRLADACGESVFLGVWDEDEVVYVRRVESPKSAVVVRKLGQRAPVHCTATGLALLSGQATDERIASVKEDVREAAADLSREQGPLGEQTHVHGFSSSR